MSELLGALGENDEPDPGSNSNSEADEDGDAKVRTWRAARVCMGGLRVCVTHAVCVCMGGVCAWAATPRRTRTATLRCTAGRAARVWMREVLCVLCFGGGQSVVVFWGGAAASGALAWRQAWP